MKRPFLPLSSKDMYEIIAAESMAVKLQGRVAAIQRQIAQTLSDVDAMSWPDNLLGEMTQLLEERRYSEIAELLERWRIFAERSALVKDLMRDTGTLIQAFFDFYSESNGHLWGMTDDDRSE